MRNIRDKYLKQSGLRTLIENIIKFAPSSEGGARLNLNILRSPCADDDSRPL